MQYEKESPKELILLKRHEELSKLRKYHQDEIDEFQKQINIHFKEIQNTTNEFFLITGAISCLNDYFDIEEIKLYYENILDKCIK